MKKLTNRLAGSFLDEKGDVDFKKVSVFAFMVFTAFMITYTAIIFYKHPNSNQVFPDMAWVSVVGGALGFTITQAQEHIKQQKNEN